MRAAIIQPGLSYYTLCESRAEPSIYDSSNAYYNLLAPVFFLFAECCSYIKTVNTVLELLTDSYLYDRIVNERKPVSYTKKKKKKSKLRWVACSKKSTSTAKATYSSCIQAVRRFIFLEISVKHFNFGSCEPERRRAVLCFVISNILAVCQNNGLDFSLRILLPLRQLLILSKE